MKMRIEKTLQKLKPVLGRKADALWLTYQMERDIKRKREIEGLINLIAAKLLDETYERKRILLEPPPEEVADGGYRIGTVCYRDEGLYPFGLRESEWCQHISVFGRSGSSKTNCAFILIKSLIENHKPFLVFDWHREYRDLLQLDWAREIKVYTVGRDINPFFFNPLDPPGDDEAERVAYLREIVSLICEIYFSGMQLLSVEGVEFLMLKFIDDILATEDNRLSFSRLFRKAIIHKPSFRERDWMSSILNVLYKLNTGPIGKVMNSKEKTPIKKLLEGNIILELDSLGGPKDKSFLIQSLLLWIYHYRLRMRERNVFKHAIFVEEANSCLRETPGSTAIHDLVMMQIRKLGESVVLIGEHPSEMSKQTLGNTYTTIAFNLKHRDDVDAVADCMLLDREEKDYLNMLKPGYGIVKLQGRWSKPFLVKFEEVKLKRGTITDEMISRRS